MFECPYCPREFSTQRGLSVHIGWKHKEYLPPRPITKRYIKRFCPAHQTKEYGRWYYNLVFKGVLEIEHKLGNTITMPQTCHFCDEEIMKKYGKKSESLCFHSLDGDHDNWDPDNKVPAHNGCHVSFHLKGRPRPDIMGDRSPMTNPEIPKKIWKIRRELYPPTGYKDPEAWKRAVAEGKRRAKEERQ